MGLYLKGGGQGKCVETSVSRRGPTPKVLRLPEEERVTVAVIVSALRYRVGVEKARIRCVFLPRSCGGGEGLKSVSPRLGFSIRESREEKRIHKSSRCTAPRNCPGEGGKRRRVIALSAWEAGEEVKEPIQLGTGHQRELQVKERGGCSSVPQGRSFYTKKAEGREMEGENHEKRVFFLS